MDRLLRATVNTWHGLIDAARSEAAFRQELVALVVSVPLAFVVAGDAWKRLIDTTRIVADLVKNFGLQVVFHNTPARSFRGSDSDAAGTD